MKLIALGDIHGRNIWKQIIEKETADKIIFMGDYFDSEDISALQQIENFNHIIDFKLKNLNKVILLCGNHDYHYLRGVQEKYSGYQNLHSFDIGELLHTSIHNELIQMCFIYNQYLFTHAGVSKTWVKNNGIDMVNIEQSINDLFKYKNSSFKFTVGENYDIYGNDICQTPIWIRPESLAADMINEYIQIVGHTMKDNIAISETLLLIDTLGTSKEYLVIDDYRIRIGRLE